MAKHMLAFFESFPDTHVVVPDDVLHAADKTTGPGMAGTDGHIAWNTSEMFGLLYECFLDGACVAVATGRITLIDGVTVGTQSLGGCVAGRATKVLHSTSTLVQLERHALGLP